jgi:hypothetical protein
MELIFKFQVPVFPFALNDRVGVPEDDIQTAISQLLAAFAGAALFTKSDSPSNL